MSDDWISLGPEGGSITTLSIDSYSPETFYVGTHNAGVFITTDGGKHWKGMNTGLDGNPVRILTINPKSPEILYTCTSHTTYNHEKNLFDGSTGVFRSADGGNHWDSGRTGLEDSFVNALTIDPKSPEILYAGTEKRIYKSTDSGTTWTAVYESTTYINATALAIDPVSPQTVYAGTEMAGVLKSMDGGRSWTVVNEGLDNICVTALAIDPKSPETIYVGITGGIGIISPDRQTVKYTRGGIFKSTNGGRSWEPVNRDLNEHIIHTLEIDPKSPETVYTIASKGGNLISRLYRSVNGGKAWTAVSTEAYNPSVVSLAVDPNTGTVYLGTSCCGVIRSTDSIGE